VGDAARIANGARGASIVAIAGVVAIGTLALFFVVGQPFGTINDLTLLAMSVALLPVMLAHYQLGGVVPLWPARLSLAGAALVVVAWSITQIALILGVAAYDYDHAATGVFGLNSALLALIGLWIAGASLFAGPWLPRTTRVLGIVAGVGTLLMSIGLLLGGGNHPLTWVGGVGYQFVLPAWAFLLSRVFGRSARP
jgi:hypothetical protein